MKRPEHRPWRVLSSEYVARRPWFTVRRESVELPTGAVVPEWYVFEFPDWVNVIARTREGLFVMISQYRHALGETRYELVAGTCEQGETPLESAQRELLEEAGYGGGMGCMEGTCGALVGAVMVAGMLADGQGAGRYAREILLGFRERCGATLCKDLKGVETGKVLCPCNECVRSAVLAAGEALGEN